MLNNNVYFSVIIPTLNEERNIAATIRSILEQSFKNFEIIVVDGKSTDKTVKIAKKYCKTLIAPKRGIYNQINHGIKYAKGEFICFLEADTKIANSALEKIYKKVKYDSAIVAGSCNYTYDDNSIKFKLLSKLVTLFFILFKMGGGGFFFARKSIFNKLKFTNKYIGWDIDFLNRAKIIGKFKFVYDTYSITSTRRFKKEGFLKTTIKQTMVVLDPIFNTNLVNANEYIFGNHKYS